MWKDMWSLILSITTLRFVTTATATCPVTQSDVQLRFLHNHKAGDLSFFLKDHLANAVPSSLIDCHLRYSFSTFTDKPLPFLGYGAYGNFQQYPADHCLHTRLTLGLNHSDLTTTIASLPDPPIRPRDLSHEEAVLDALLRLLRAFEPSDLDLVVLTTDTWSHTHGQAAEAVAAWNAPRQYSNSGFSTGGFGAELFTGVNLSTDQDATDWLNLATAFRQRDHQEEEESVTLPMDLVSKFGPYPWPPIEEDPDAGCSSSEYPSAARFKATAGKRSNLYVIFGLLAPPLESGLGQALLERCGPGTPLDSCLQALYERYMLELDLRGLVVAAETPEQLTSQLQTAILSVVAGVVEQEGSTPGAEVLERVELQGKIVAASKGEQKLTRDERTESTDGGSKSTSVAFAASFAAASGALITSLLAGLLIWQRYAEEDEELLSDQEELVSEGEETEPGPLSRADRVVLAFRGYPVDHFEPLDSSTRRESHDLPDQFF
eukprot:Protomagalhaensia_sp_Gyna_25__828@NODE_13_length_8454_cov_77_233868_g9_i0_p3_GENE_NODE_13_length_8454_cov_77_233868_g9_i0NODE_13_length_8454_cov_77_233868_g9_i0_p3_ORF_typecomplete_len490_score86_26stn_TNFRSF12A/PF12191_8/1_2e04stn_TNFRSF12A/PF12191_8/0_16Integrin_beta/PF00362_18/0_19Integrin_beta/PF00362_18/9_4e03DUF1902/PF08972_11/0_24_NODE_13_length_8454_cov_77_233868_g9_i034534922